MPIEWGESTVDWAKRRDYNRRAFEDIPLDAALQYSRRRLTDRPVEPSSPDEPDGPPVLSMPPPASVSLLSQPEPASATPPTPPHSHPAYGTKANRTRWPAVITIGIAFWTAWNVWPLIEELRSISSSAQRPARLLYTDDLVEAKQSINAVYSTVENTTDPSCNGPFSSQLTLTGNLTQAAQNVEWLDGYLLSSLSPKIKAASTKEGCPRLQAVGIATSTAHKYIKEILGLLIPFSASLNRSAYAAQEIQLNAIRRKQQDEKDMGGYYRLVLEQIPLRSAAKLEKHNNTEACCRVFGDAFRCLYDRQHRIASEVQRYAVLGRDLQELGHRVTEFLEANQNWRTGSRSPCTVLNGQIFEAEFLRLLQKAIGHDGAVEAYQEYYGALVVH